jgi:hypothetical protein
LAAGKPVRNCVSAHLGLTSHLGFRAKVGKQLVKGLAALGFEGFNFF